MAKLIQNSIISVLLLSLGPVHAAENCAGENFPTSAKVDYVIGCMAANGQTPEILQRCSCSIDYIESNLTYDEYVEADTVMQIQLSAGERGIFFRNSSWAKVKTDKLAKVQALSTLECF